MIQAHNTKNPILLARAGIRQNSGQPRPTKVGGYQSKPKLNSPKFFSNNLLYNYDHSVTQICALISIVILIKNSLLISIILSQNLVMENIIYYNLSL